jgi:hypothetical protein
MIRVQLTRDLTADAAASVGVPETPAGTILVLDMPDAWTVVTGGYGHFADVARLPDNVIALPPRAA